MGEDILHHNAEILDIHKHPRVEGCDGVYACGHYTVGEFRFVEQNRQLPEVIYVEVS